VELTFSFATFDKSNNLLRMKRKRDWDWETTGPDEENGIGLIGQGQIKRLQMAIELVGTMVHSH